ncbi:hypothetical protein [Aurantivibrio plasticivorans]
MPTPVKLANSSNITNTGGYPVEIKPGKLAQYQPLNTKTQLRINNFVWANTPIKPGVTFLTSQGARLVLEANNSRVIYVIVSQGADLNKVFSQPARGYINDVVTYPFEEAGRNLQTTKKIAEYEVQFLIGMMSTTGWLAFIAVLSTDVLHFCVKNSGNFSYWKQAFQASLKANADLKQYAPMLRKKLLHSAFLAALEGTNFAVSEAGDFTGNLAEAAINDPNIAGRGAGIIAGKITPSLLEGRLTALSACWTILATVATKAASAIPGALAGVAEDVSKLPLEDKAALARELVAAIRQSDIHLSESEAQTIVDEVTDHPLELAKVLKDLKEGFTKK